MEAIEIGDKVRHKHLLTYNALLMTVLDIDGDKILCEYFDSEAKTSKQVALDLNELELVQKTEGGFVP